jgi:hypothetical protein
MQEKIAELMQIRKESGYKGQAIFPTEEEIKRIELSLINNQLTPDGVYMPVLTEDQKELAKNRIRKEIDFSFGTKMSGTPLQVPTRNTEDGGGNRGPSEDKKEKPITKYEQMVDAWRNADFNALNGLIPGTKYTIGLGPNGSGYAVYEKVNGRNKLRYMNPEGKLDSGYLKYFFGNSPGGLTEGKRQQDLYRQGAYGGNASPKTNKNVGKAPR